jgi:DNA-binding transcriptional regulator YiaG
MINENALQSNGAACPDCNSDDISERTSSHDFEYGLGNQRIVLSAIFPVFHCDTCSFEFTDSRAEKARHDAVCRHLGVLTPSEIIAIREARELTRAQFADLGGFGLASLQRWESGSLIQNAANDRLIYLLQFTANCQRLARKLQDCRTPLAEHGTAWSQARDGNETTPPTFRQAISLQSLASEASLTRNADIFSELLNEGAVFAR